MMMLIGAALLTFSGVAAADNGKNLDFYNIEEQQLVDMFAQHQGGTPGQSIKDFSPKWAVGTSKILTEFAVTH